MRARLPIALGLGAVLGGAAVLPATGPREPWLPHAAPRGLCERPPGAASGGTMCDEVGSPPW